METDLLIVTHALTRWNVEGRIQGHTDVPLNREGRGMAEQLARYLECERIHAVYASDLKRAVETALPFSKRMGLDVKTDRRLREGRSVHQERSARFPTLAFSPEVETEEIVLERMKSVLSDIAVRNRGRNVLVVSHAGAVEIFIGYVITTESSPLRYNGVRMTINRIRFDCDQKEWHCIHLNESVYPVSENLNDMGT